MEQLSRLASEILTAWRTSGLSPVLSTISDDQQQLLATIAARRALQLQSHQVATESADGKIVDDVTGLILPPEPGRPYRERGYHERDGRRLSVFEHLRKEYGAYLDAHLLFSGHLQAMDRPAYEAVLYLARKDARAKGLDDEIGNTAAFFLEHGILAGEHLEFPPEHLTRQAAVINKCRAVSIVPRLRGRKAASKRPSEGQSRENR